MVKAQEVLNLMQKTGFVESVGSTSSEEIKQAFEELFDLYDLTGISVTAEKDGSDWIVEFAEDGDSEVIIFGVDEDGNAYASKVTDEGDLDEQSEVIDLIDLDPEYNEDGSLDLTDVKFNKLALQAVFSEINTDESNKNEKFKIVIRGGKKVKVPVKLRKKRLTSKQRAAFAKRKGKKKSSAAKRKQAMSMRIRRRMGLGSKAA